MVAATADGATNASRHIEDVAAVLHYTPHPWQCFTQPLELTNEAALWAIPQYHVVCTSTLSTRDPDLVARARDEGRLWDIDTGHDLKKADPKRVAEALVQVAGR
jgi:hypothetical protein